MPKPSASGRSDCARIRRDQRLGVGRHLVARAGDAEPGDHVEKPAPERPTRPGSARRSSSGSGGRSDRAPAPTSRSRNGPASSTGRSSTSTPSTPASAAAVDERRLAHAQDRIGVGEEHDRRVDPRRASSRIISSAPRSVVPLASARSDARWITGPSASGSENGTPTSRTSAPFVGQRDQDLRGAREIRIAGRDVGHEARLLRRRARG